MYHKSWNLKLRRETGGELCQKNDLGFRPAVIKQNIKQIVTIHNHKEREKKQVKNDTNNQIVTGKKLSCNCKVFAEVLLTQCKKNLKPYAD